MAHKQVHIITGTDHTTAVTSANNLLGMNSDGATIEFKWILGSGNQLTPIFAQTSLTYGFVSKVMCNYIYASSIGGGVQIREGSNARMGTGVLTLGTVNISNSTITAFTRIFVSDAGGNIGSLGALYSTVTQIGSSFTVASSSPTDVSNFNWMMVEGS